ncbi:semaphorin-1A-like [Lytechinus variegatus]|uniref:semaphorin-1A-like n=1 Tax=Lytechinus variegatus TaxID=7654 RepID=UPI001BB1774F|nr:semaphorin-1A-like [Lytechinus variegatus]
MELLLVCTLMLSCLIIQSHSSTPIIANLPPEVAGVEKVYSKPGTMGFRILHRESDSALIGGREMLLTLNHNDPNSLHKSVEEFKTCDNGDAFIQCRTRTTFKKDRDCFNFIRIAEVISNNMLLVCGTNALNPRCYNCNLTRNSAGMQEVSCPGPRGDGTCQFSRSQPLGTVDGTNIAPKHWELNATSQYSDGQLFLGVSQSHGKSETTISRVDVYPDSGFTNRLDTTSYFSRSVNEADFVGKPLVIGDRVYYFYRELAVEHVNQGKLVYSRVARVCKGDNGIDNFWSSFQKARLSCSIPGEFPLYFNDLQDIFVEERGSDHYIHAAFAGVPNGPQSSAVCVFLLSEINEIFDTSNFKGPASSDSIWLSRPSREIPVPRPGLDCNNPTQDIRYIRQYPLMQDDASSIPLFIVDYARFTSIVMDSLPAGNIYYIGTESGSVLKAYYNGTEFKVYEVTVTDNKQPVVGLQLAGDSTNRHIIVVSDNAVYRVPLHNCATSCERRCSELMYGYCQWEGGCCKSYGETTCSENPVDVYVTIEPSQSMTVCENEIIQLVCHAQTAPFCQPITLDWTMAGGQPIDNMGHLISLDQLYDYPLHKLSALTVQSAITGNTTTMECTARTTIGGQAYSVTKATTINIQNCITQGSLERRYNLHQQLKQENTMSKSCDAEIFDCANCASFP